MKKNLASETGIFNPRIFLTFAFCSASALLAFGALITQSSAPAPGTISTFAGDGGSSGLATNIAHVVFGAVVNDGYLYVADWRWNVVRRIDLTTRAEIIIAGNGLVGNGVEKYNGDGIPAVQAQLRAPYDVGIDDAGNLYIAEFGESRIRKVDALDGTGTITTIAGTGVSGYNGDGIPATLAQLSCPEGMDVDLAGNVYVADTRNHRIRRIDASTGVITTVAGTGAAAGGIVCVALPTADGGYNGDNIPAATAELNSPTSVELDASGNVFVADFWNHRIRRIDAATAIITTYAGTGVSGYNGDNVPATQAKLYNPRGMSFDAAGNLYFTDQANQRVRKIAATLPNVISTVAGNGVKGVSEDGGLATSASLVNPWDLAADSAGNVYIADHADYPFGAYLLSHRIRKVAPSGIISTFGGNRHAFYGGDGGPAKTSQFNEILAVGVGAGCNIYMTNDRVLDPDLNRVRRVSCDGTLTTFAGAGPEGFGGDGGPATAALLRDPTGVVGDAAGTVYIADTFNNRVRKVDPAGIITTYAGTGTPSFGGDGGPATAASLYGPAAVALDIAGNLYVADSANYRIRRIDVTPPHTISTVAGTGVFGYSGDGGPAASAQISYVQGIDLDAAGNLFIADRNNRRVRRVDGSTGTITTVAGNGVPCANPPCPAGDGAPAMAAQVNAPEDVAFDAAGNLYIADSSNNRIRKVAAGANGTIEPLDTITTVAGTGDKAYGGDGGPATAAQLNVPRGVALDGLGNLYVADFANRRVRRVEGVGPLLLQSVVSRKAHGSAGAFDVDLALTGPPGIECRSGGANRDYTLVFTFSNILTSVGGANVTSGNGSVSSSTIDSSDAHRYIVNLTGVTNAQTITVTLANVNDAAGNKSNAISASMDVLLGDVNGNRVVSNTDVSPVKAQVAAAVSASNFRNDVNASGTVNNTDVGITKGQVSAQLP